jgi:hypothetical protein
MVGSLMSNNRATVGENWNGFMRDCMVQEPFCNGPDCGSPGQAVAYWISFEVISKFLLLNVVIAVVIKHFEEEFEQGHSAVGPAHHAVSSGEVVTFGRVWSLYAQRLGQTMVCVNVILLS